MSDSHYRQYVVGLVTSGNADGRPRHEVREEIVSYVEAGCGDGEPWALSVAQRWDVEGADRDYGDAFKSLHTTTYIRADGRRVKKTTGYSMPKRSSSDGRVVGQELKAFWDKSRPELAELLLELAAQHRALGEIVEAIGLVAAAMDRHPECDTARQAWEADGRSVDEIDLGEIAT